MFKTLQIAFCLFILSALSVFSQDANFEKIAPRPVEGLSGKSNAPKVPEMHNVIGQDSEEMIIEYLMGIQLVNSPDELKRVLREKTYGTNVINFSIPAQLELLKKLNPHLAKPASMSKLQEIGREITKHYQLHDRPVVTVVTPPQDISDGIVTYVVVDSKVGKIYATGAKHFNNEEIAKQIRLEQGNPISKKTLEEDLDWVNRNPFRDVSLIYEKGDSFGTTNLNLAIDDRFPLQVYTGYENNGNESTGLNRWLLGGNYGNLFGMDHQLGAQISSSGDKRFLSTALTYSIPFAFRTNLLLYGSYSKTDADLPEPFTQKGSSYQVGTRLSKKLPSLGKIKQEIEVGFDIKRSSSDLQLGGISEGAETSKIAQIAIRYFAKLEDKLGHTKFTASVYHSPGDLFSNNHKRDFRKVRTFSDPNYTYGLLEIDRTTELLFGTSLVSEFTAQISSENLLPSEQLFAGGYYNVRGYSESIALGDIGILFSTELHAPPFSILNNFDMIHLQDNVDLYAFWDYANVENIDLLPGEDKSTSLSSVGIGMRYYIYPHFSFNIDYGWQLKRLGSLEPDHSRLHVSSILSY